MKIVSQNIPAIPAENTSVRLDNLAVAYETPTLKHEVKLTSCFKVGLTDTKGPKAGASALL